MRLAGCSQRGLSYRISAFALTHLLVPSPSRASPDGLPILCQKPSAVFKSACIPSSSSTGSATYSPTSTPAAAVCCRESSTDRECRQPGAVYALPGRSLRELCDSSPAYYGRNDSHGSYPVLDEDYGLAAAYSLPKLILHEHHHRPYRRVSVTRRDLP
jgi:hypothetical protein